MKKLFILLAIFFSSGLIVIPSQQAQAQHASVSFQVFYDQLSPYGSWVNYSNYGYVWIPTDVPVGFRPYATGGHWIYTEDGWTWVSDYTWGWAAFHYGNWFYDQSYGWMWLPDYEWAPAWVTWGQYEDNYCWAPIGPHVNIGVSYTSYRPPVYYWTFVPRTYITNVNINRYYVNRISNTTVVNNITVINNVNRGGGGGRAFMRGPEAQNVERYTHNPVRPVQIREASAPGRGQIQNGQLALYRPAINRASANTKPAPTKVEDVSRIKPASLPATNRDVHTNNANRPDNVDRKPGSAPVPNNAPVTRKPVPAPAPSNSAPVIRSAPRTEEKRLPTPNPSSTPREFNNEQNKNKQVMKPSPPDRKQVSTQPVNRPINEAPPVHSNRPSASPANNRPPNAGRPPVQQRIPQQEQRARPMPPVRQPAPQHLDQPQSRPDQRHR